MFKALKSEKKWIFVYLVFSIALTVLRLLGPALVSTFFDSAEASDIEFLLKIVIAMLAAFLFSGFLHVLCSILDLKVKNRIIIKCKNEYLKRLLKMDYEDLETIDFGEKKNRYDLNDVYSNIAVSFVANTIIETFTCVIVFIYLLTINKIMAAILVLSLFINSVLQYKIGNKSYKFSKEITKTEAKYEGEVVASLKNIPYIKTNNCADIITRHILNTHTKLAQSQEKHIKEISYIDNLSFEIYKIIEVILFAVAAYMLKSNTITVGQIYVFICYMGWVDNAFSTIWNNIVTYKSAKARADVIKSTFKDSDYVNDFKIENESINTFSLSNIGYKYRNGDFELKDINIDLKKGDFVAVIGESGSGKSTLMKVISGLYHPSCGKVMYNNHNIALLSPENRSSVIAYVSQNIAVMDGTVRELVDFLKTDCSDEIICKALDTANLLPFVNNLKSGIDTYIGEGAINLSGGQLQRLAIAQAMVYEKQVYIFDEVTSGLDEETQEQLINNLKEKSKDKIMIFVTHRLNTLGHFNKVFVMENGLLKRQDISQ